jgi:hypothetical protein
VTALAKSVVVAGVSYAAGTDHTALPVAVVDKIRNPGAWVGGVVPALQAAPLPGEAQIGLADLRTPGRARAALGIDSSVAYSGPGISIPPGWGQHWQAKLAAAERGAGLARVGLVGTSITQGYFASNLRQTSYASRLRRSLQGFAGDGGSGYEGFQRSDVFLSGLPGSAYAHYQASGDAWGFTGTWTTPTWWLGPSLGYLRGTGGSTVRIPFTGTAVDIWWFNVYSSAAWTYRVDTGATVTVTPGAGVGTGDLAVTATTVSGLPAGEHLLTITSGDPGMWLAGITGRNATGVRVDNFGIAGMESAGWANGDPFNSGTYMGGWRNPCDLLIIEGAANDVIKARHTYGNVTTTSGSTTISSVSLRPSDAGRRISGSGIPADALIVSVNDNAGTAVLSANASASASNVTVTLTDPDPVGRWISNIQQYLSGVLDNWYGGGSAVEGKLDVVFLWPLFPTNTGNDPLGAYKRLQSAGRSLAESYGAATVDIGALYHQSWSRWFNEGRAGNAADPAIAGNDAVHPSDAGHELIADTLLKLVRRTS